MASRVKLDKEKYKPRLKEYLEKRGYDVSKNPSKCFNLSHYDDTPSLSVSDNGLFNCFGCGIAGDIYKAVEIIEGISSFKEQYKFLENFFGDGVYIPTVKNKKEFISNPEACKKFEEWLLKHQDTEKAKAFLSLRTEKSSNRMGFEVSYQDSTVSAMAEHLYYFPGFQTAKQELPAPILFGAGIPFENRETGKSSWDSAGVVVKLGTGYKLHYYNENGCQKINSKSCEAFPTPGVIDKSLPVILVEGELKAITCLAAGIKNVFSTGGTSGLKDEGIKTHLLDVSEIIICFDADEAGRKSAGLDHSVWKKSIPQRLISAGYTGKIRIAELPRNTACNDPEDFILAGKTDIVLQAIKDAKEVVLPVKQREKQQIQQALTSFAVLTVKRLKSLLRKLPRENLDEADIQAFVCVCTKAFNDPETRSLLEVWGATALDFEFKSDDITPNFLIDIAKKYLSKYYQRQIEKELTPPEELIKRIQIGDAKLEMDFEELELNNDANHYALTGDHYLAAKTVAAALDERMIWVEEDKEFYFYDGHVWQYEPDMAGVIHSVLGAVLRHFIAIDPQKKNTFFETFSKMRDSSFLTKVKKLFSGLTGVYKKRMHFDSITIKDTVTLKDCVMDLTGDKVIYRSSKPEEYRHYALPYTKTEVESASTENFIKYMQSIFPNKDTFKTAMYKFSFIPTRNTSFKEATFLIGDTNTGKTTLVNLMMKVYGDMTDSIVKTVIASKGKEFSDSDKATPELAKILTKSAVFMGELGEGDRLNAERLKMLTGGDIVPFRQLFKSADSAEAMAQLILYTNYLPKFEATDEAILTRITTIPFKVVHLVKGEGAKKDIIKELEPEFPGIVRLFAEYYINIRVKEGNTIPISKECEDEKSRYILDQATDIDEFIRDNVIYEKGCFTKGSDAYARYLEYFEYDENAKGVYKQSGFTREIKRKYEKKGIYPGSKSVSGTTHRGFFGMKLKPMDQVGANASADNVPAPDEDPFGKDNV